MSIIRKFFKIKNNFFRKFFFSKVLKKYFSYRYLVYYNKKNDSVLSKLSNNLSTDKGYTLDKLKNENLDAKQYHDYLDFYSDLFNLSRDYIKKVFELGIGSVDSNQMYNMLHIGKNYSPGGSLRLWKKYFKSATIYGADIDKKTLFSEERIKTFYVDQGNVKSIIDMWNLIRENDFDIIIDDGCHRFEETIIFFENSINKLSETGIYIIEDILLSQKKKFFNYFKETEYNVKFITFNRPGYVPLNNHLIMITK